MVRWWWLVIRSALPPWLGGTRTHWGHAEVLWPGHVRGVFNLVLLELGRAIPRTGSEPRSSILIKPEAFGPLVAQSPDLRQYNTNILFKKFGAWVARQSRREPHGRLVVETAGTRFSLCMVTEGLLLEPVVRLTEPIES